MTVKDIIEMAHKVHNGWTDGAMSRAFAGYVLDLLDVAAPCGYSEPYVCEQHRGCVFDGAHYHNLDEWRALCVAGLRAADEADGGGS